MIRSVGTYCSIKVQFSLQIWLNDSICRYLLTVGNRVVIIPGCDFFESCFLVLFSIVNTPTKKKQQCEIPCYLPLFRYLPSKSKFQEKSVTFFAAEGSTLEANNSSSVRILFNMYILIRKVFLVSFPMMYV
jgi:hypothetical protein